MSDDFKNAVVNISEVSQTEKQIKFKTGEGTFSFFILKQNGEETKAYQDWVKLGLRAGKDIEVGYKEVPFTTKSGENVKLKNAIGFKQPNPSLIPIKGKNDNPDWEAITAGKVRHGVVCAMLQAGKGYEEIATNLMRYEDLIMRGTKKQPDVMSEDGFEANEEEVSVEDIPF